MALPNDIVAADVSIVFVLLMWAFWFCCRWCGRIGFNWWLMLPVFTVVWWLWSRRNLLVWRRYVLDVASSDYCWLLATAHLLHCVWIVSNRKNLICIVFCYICSSWRTWDVMCVCEGVYVCSLFWHGSDIAKWLMLPMSMMVWWLWV